MPLNVEYETHEQARLRLEGTVVMYDGEPVYVSEVSSGDDGKYRVHIQPLPLTGSRTNRKLLSSRLLDLEPARLGYCNTATAPVILSRLPSRRTKQGLCGNSCAIRPGNVEYGASSRYDSPNFFRLMSTSEFVDCLKNVFPAPSAVADSLTSNPEITGMAFSHEFAVYKRPAGYFLLYHKGEEVGFSGDCRSFKLGPSYTYLRELLTKQNLTLG